MKPACTPLPTCRADLLARLAVPREYDLAVVGGGATGLGVALDAAARGFSVVLVESHDFAQGTSSRATKLVHGGVRYLAQGNIALVRQALNERATLLGNAPHIAQALPFVVPAYRFWEMPFYGLGLMLYDALAGKSGLGKTDFLSQAQTLQRLPTLQTHHLRGGIQYWDGQFDDARLALALARTAAVHGALVVNYCDVCELIHECGRVAGFICQDARTQRSFTVRARSVVNATGVWVDTLRRMDGQATHCPVKPMLTPSQGVHIVVDREFLPANHALMVPRTSDRRVLFAVPWLGKLILGTTDTPREDIVREPQPFGQEVAFILNEAGRYLSRAPKAADIKSIWVGLRPLVKPEAVEGSATKSLSREHTVVASPSGLITVTGGKWTTYRAMAEDVLEKCFSINSLRERPAGITRQLRLVGAPEGEVSHRMSDAQGPHSYGTEAPILQKLPGADTPLGHSGLTAAMVRFAARYEYALTVEDVLARRSRLLFLDARQAMDAAPAVAALLQEEGCDNTYLESFLQLAQQYLKLPEIGA